MKSSKLILALWLGASSWAQTLPQKQQVNLPVAAKPNAAQTAPRSRPLPKTPAATNAASREGPVATPRYARVQAPQAPAMQVSARSYSRTRGRNTIARQSSAKRAIGKDGAPVARGRRDPFVSPVVERIRDAATCTGSGRRCLLVGEISLHGVVLTPSGFIAVVVNGEHTYFLRENDPLADGAVERITRDAIILRERSSDTLGRPLTREVTKKLGVPAV